MALIIPSRLMVRCHGLNLSWKHDKTQGRCNSCCPAKCTQMSESSSWPMPSSFRWEPRGSTRKCIFLFIEGEMRDVMVMKWDILGCGRCLTEAAGFFALTLVSISFPWQHSCACACPSELIPPLCPFAVICISLGSKASALLRYLPSFPNYTFPSSISFLQFHSKRKKIHLLSSDINVTADSCSPGSQAILWIEQFIK